MMAEKVTIGDCTLYHGDCREVLPMLPKSDLILTDPPYGIAKQMSDGIGHKWDHEWDDCTPPEWLFGLMQEKAVALIIWGGNYYAMPPSRGWLAWRKPDRVQTMADFELAWTSLDMNTRMIDQTIAATNAERVGHPTQKPLRVMEWSLSFAPDARTVCDPFMGSGTTGVACARMGLQFVGIERERKYFDIACRRIEQAYAQPRLFEDAKVGAGETAVQGDMLLPANA
jgi:site-specific DNA-methyltransferase (adenine-specific)/modification methylase